ncbi:SpoIID/LytB domain-containing protein [soil metagenome]
MRLLLALTLLLCLLCPFGCSTEPSINTANPTAPIVRVRLIESASSVSIVADRPAVRVGPMPVAAQFPAGPALQVGVATNGWIIGNQLLPPGELVLQPTRLGGVTINGQQYRGALRFVPNGPGKFDVINDVEIDDYLRGVVAKEMLNDWAEEAYRAQAIVARTYALFESKSAPAGRSWDLLPDQRSQVYGGLQGETDKARRAVDSTAGIVVAYGPAGQEKIFKAYFSSCCGGIGQNPTDGLNEPFHPAMIEQNVGHLCAASPRFNWGPITVSKDELTRRIKLFGKAKGRAEANLTQLARLDKQAVNQFGRPVRFTITDINGTRYSLSGEELRWAVNTGAPKDQILYSSFIEPTDTGNAIRFTGHGFGHGIGMCQWCAQTRALQGLRHEDIVLLAYPGSKLLRAY